MYYMYNNILGSILFGLFMLLFTFSMYEYEYTRKKKYKSVCILSVIGAFIVNVLDALELL